jgi:predicted Zn finger-like uncharacterized protein
MPDHIINCPQCQRQLRVPEEMLGRLVKCPTCSTTFTVGAGSEALPPELPREAGAAPAASPPLPPEYYADASRPQPQPEPGSYYPDTRSQAASAVLPPGICLIITGILGAAVAVLSIVVAVGNPDMIKESYARLGMQVDTPPLGLVLVMHGTFLLISLLTVVGAIQMIRRRTFGLAMAGAIVAMININSLCCCLGLPFGIWALVVLVRPDVRELFQ